MDTSNTKVYKARDGWNAKDTIDMATTMWLGITGTRQLEIRTYKNSNGGIHTFASCHFNAAGMTTFDIYGDYRKRVAALPDVRCTEKSVKTLHATVMAQQADAILIEARDFYAKKDAAKALNAKRDAELAAQDTKKEWSGSLDPKEPGISGSTTTPASASTR
mgnify:FL=1